VSAALLTTAEVAERYRVSRVTLWNWRRAATFPQPSLTLPGGQLRWDLSDLVRWEKARAAVLR